MKVRSVNSQGKPVRRGKTPTSNPSYPLELTRAEMFALLDAALDHIDDNYAAAEPALISAAAVIRWRIEGRQ